MFQKIISYLEKLGYTVEEQGRLEKYLVVFKDNLPVGFIMSDLSVRLISDAEGDDGIQEIIGFIQKNQNLQSIGSSEFLILDYRGNQLTTFYDDKSRTIKFASYVHDGNGEVQSVIYQSEDTAIHRFIIQTQMIDLKKFLPAKSSLKDRIRQWLIRFLQEGQQ